jgi:hypothetical protein
MCQAPIKHISPYWKTERQGIGIHKLLLILTKESMDIEVREVKREREG